MDFEQDEICNGETSPTEPDDFLPVVSEEFLRRLPYEPNDTLIETQTNDTPVETQTEDPAQIIRRHYAEWLAEGVRYEIDFSIGEDGVAIPMPIEGQPTMAEWLDEWTGMFYSAHGWATHGDFVESHGGPATIEAIRQGEFEGPTPRELEAAMQKVQDESTKVNWIKEGF